MNGVNNASGRGHDTPRAPGAGTATVSRPAFVTRGEMSEPGSFSLLSGVTTAVTSAHVWNGAVNGETARARNASANRFLSIPNVHNSSPKCAQLQPNRGLPRWRPHAPKPRWARHFASQ